MTVTFQEQLTVRGTLMAEQVQQGPVWDAAALSGAQRAGSACVGCGKRWPRPRVPVGTIPDGTPMMACPECAALMDAELRCATLVQPGRLADSMPLIAAGLLRGAVLLVDLGLVPHTDLRAAVHMAGHHTAVPACAAADCQLCQAANAALVALATDVEQTEQLLVDVDVVNGDLDRAMALLRAWLDTDTPPRAVVLEALTAVARDLEA